jgi:hypothetical protein
MSGAARIASLLAALIGATTIAFADDVDWKFYGGVSVQNTLDFCFFDVKSVTQESAGQLRVWTKCLAQKDLERTDFDETATEKVTQKITSGYVPPIVIIGVMKFDQIPFVVMAEETANLGNIEPKARMLLEFNCVEQKQRRLSTYIRTNGGDMGFSSKPSDWDYIPPETNGAYLQKILCR